MEAFLTSHGFNYNNLCNAMMKYENNPTYISGETALYVYLTIAGKSPNWMPKFIKFNLDMSSITAFEDYIKSLGYAHIASSDSTSVYTKSESIPIIINNSSNVSHKLSILNMKWAPDTRFMNGDKSVILDAINMRAICYNPAMKELIELYKSRGFKIFQEL
jgi:hypothetical protein